MVTVLLVADSGAERSLVLAALQDPAGRFEVRSEDCLAGALARMAEAAYDCLLVDMQLPDVEIVEIVATLREAADAAIVVLTDRTDDALGTQVLRHGAEDFLLAGERSSQQLRRAIAGAVERAGSRANMWRLSARALAVLHALGDGLIVLDAAGRVSSANSPALEVFGGSEAALLGQPITTPPWSACHRDGTRITDEEHPVSVTLATGEARRDVVAGIARGDGDWVWVELSTYPLTTPAGTVDGAVVTVRDVTARLAADDARRVQTALLSGERKQAEETAQALSAIVTSSADAIFTKALDGTILSWNQGAERLYGYRRDDVVGQHISLLDPDSAHTESRALLAAAATGETVRGLETSRRRRDGSMLDVSLTVSPIYGHGHAVVAASVIARDISDRKRIELELARQAMHDPLTRLPNRTLLADRLAQALAAAARHGLAVGVLFLDLDQFKAINDAHGHGVGDELLVEVANRLRAVVGGDGTVARFGGDEFVVVGEYVDGAAVELAAERLADALEPPIDIDGQRLYASASIGIAAAPPLEADADTLVRNANTAMYDAKAQGRARRSVFNVSQVRPWTERLELSNELHEALTQDALEVHYQPMIELATGFLVGVEALVRWWHPIRQWVPPSLFVPLAEERGLAPALDQWVLERACRDMATLRRSGALPVHAKVSVNISTHSVGNRDLPDRIRQSAANAKLPVDVLELEVTETGLMADPPRARRALQALRELGIGIALDDFGTGYSSLIHLRQWPVSTIKIDRAFVEHITTRSDDLAIAASIVDLGRAVGRRTIAEGIETREQLAMLHRLGCNAGQGFLWSPALTRDDLAKLLTDHSQGFEPASASEGGKRLGRRTPIRVTNEHGLHHIRRMHRDGASLATISAALNTEGFRTPNDLRWHSSTVARAITDIAYRSGGPTTAK